MEDSLHNQGCAAEVTANTAMMETESFLSSAVVMHAHLPLFLNTVLENSWKELDKKTKKHPEWRG